MSRKPLFRGPDIAVETIDDPSEGRTVVRTTQEVGPLLHIAEQLRNNTTGVTPSGAMKELGELPISLIEEEARKLGIDWWKLHPKEQNEFNKIVLRMHPHFRTSPGRM